MGMSHGRCRELQPCNPLLDLGLSDVSDATATPFRFDMYTPDRYLLKLLRQEIADPDSRIRDYLDGDVFEFVTNLLTRAETEGGQVYLALYELQDQPLIDTLTEAVKQGRAHVILSSTGEQKVNSKDTPEDQRQPAVWDTENDPGRRALHPAARGKTPQRVYDRMFCNPDHIGHNKFVVYVRDDKAKAVMTGSTNWTNTGLCAQSNNTILIEDEDLANDYWAYWKALRDDVQPKRQPYKVTVTVRGKPVEYVGAKPNKAAQGQQLRAADAQTAKQRDLGKAGTAQLWCSPNTAEQNVPRKAPATPPDLAAVYELMRKANDAIFFLTFLPGISGKNNVIGVAAELAEKPDGPLVVGAISDPKAMPNYSPKDESTYIDAAGKVKPLPPPAIWWQGGDRVAS